MPFFFTLFFFFTTGVSSFVFCKGMDCYPYQFFLSLKTFHYPGDNFWMVLLWNTMALAESRICPIPTVSLDSKSVLFPALPPANFKHSLLIGSGLCFDCKSLFHSTTKTQKKVSLEGLKLMFCGLIFVVLVWDTLEETSFQLVDAECGIQLPKYRLPGML